MLLREVSEFIDTYIESINRSLSLENAGYGLTSLQKYWLKFCLSGLLLSNTINWSSYSRLSLGYYKVSAISWMFRHSCINYERLFYASIRYVLSVYGISSGDLIFDDTDNERSKNAKKIHKLGKQKDKKSGGYFLGQNILFGLLVTEKISIPIGFVFYENDPKWLIWKKEEDRLKKMGVSKNYRPVEVERDYIKYPTKQTLCVTLTAKFKKNFPKFSIRSIIADCFFGTKDWTDGILAIYEKAQVLSQLKSNQLIVVQNVECNLKTYFLRRASIASTTTVREGKSVKIYYSSLIAKVKAHEKKRLIVAYKYEGEEDFRYVFASDMSWTPHHVIATYSLRWLIEVFISDWKRYEGWAVLTKHIGVEGSERSLNLSLLFDHCLLLHPEQQARIKNNLPAATVGSLREKAIQTHFVQTIRTIILDQDPKQRLLELVDTIDIIFPLRDSSKHLSGKNRVFT